MPETVASIENASSLAWRLELDPDHPLAYRVRVTWREAEGTAKVNPYESSSGADDPGYDLYSAARRAAKDAGLREALRPESSDPSVYSEVADALLEDL